MCFLHFSLLDFLYPFFGASFLLTFFAGYLHISPFLRFLIVLVDFPLILFFPLFRRACFVFFPFFFSIFFALFYEVFVFICPLVDLFPFSS